MSDTPIVTPTPPAMGAPAQPPPQTPPTTPPPATPPAPPTAEPTTPQGDPADLSDPGKKALEIEREGRRAAEAELAKLTATVKQIEDKDKSELDKLAEANTGLAATASDHAKLMAAMAKAPEGTTQAQILSLYKRLQGSTNEELEADAATLFGQFSGAPAPVTAPANPGLPVPPVATLQPGAPQVGAGPTLQDQIRAAEQAGDMTLSRRLKSQMTVEAMHKPS